MEPIEPTAVDPIATQPIDITELIKAHSQSVDTEESRIAPPVRESLLPVAAATSTVESDRSE